MDRSWCHKCGQNPEFHPVMEGSPQAEDARKWVRMWENQTFGVLMEGYEYD